MSWTSLSGNHISAMRLKILIYTLCLGQCESTDYIYSFAVSISLQLEEGLVGVLGHGAKLLQDHVVRGAFLHIAHADYAPWFLSTTPF